MARKLIVNADDFGFTRDVNQGILEAHRDGILTATTLMATGAAFEDAVRIAREYPSLDIGCHLVLVQGAGFPASIPQLMRALATRKIDPYAEFASQVRRIVDAGLAPTHLDTHKHTHLLPPVLDAIARVSEEFQIRWIRRPFDFPRQPGAIGVARHLVGGSLSIVRGRFTRVLSAHHCRSTDHFAGFKVTGKYDARDLASLIRRLPEGSTEFMCHPGRCGAELRAAHTRLKESREAELLALTSKQAREAIAEAGVELINYRSFR